MPRWDYKCIKCDKLRLDVVVNNWKDATGYHREICECGGEMKKQPAAPNFSIGGYNAKNHYGAKHESS